MGVRWRALLLVVLPGCFWVTTKHEGDQIRKQVTDLEGRVGKQEQSVDEKVKKLDESLDKATKLLARNSADLGSDVEKLSADMANLNGTALGVRRDNEALRSELAKLQSDVESRLAAAQARIDALEKALKAAIPGPGPGPGPGPAIDKEALFDGALKKLQAGAFAEARKDLHTFATRFASDARAASAQYWIGESFYREKEYEKAITEFQRVIDAWPASDMVDDALFEAGTAAADMKACTDARAYLGVIVQKYPQSPYAKPAKQKIELLKKQSKNKKVCQS